MSDRIAMTSDDGALEQQLRSLAEALAIPQPSAGFAAAVTARIEHEAPRRERTPLVLFPRVRRGVLLAIAATLILAAAAAAAMGWRLPGLDILFATPSLPVPTASHLPSDKPGAGLGLGTAVTLDDARGLVDFPIRLPGDPAVGPPDATYVRLVRVAMVWAPGPGLPATTDPTIGLLLNEFHGRYDETIVEKLIDAGTHVENITVGGARGYWIDGAPHFFVYLDANGREIQDTYRSVGQTLVWFRDGITYRLETGLDRDAAIRLAESLR
jgi:hypothetical protein